MEIRLHVANELWAAVAGVHAKAQEEQIEDVLSLSFPAKCWGGEMSIPLVVLAYKQVWCYLKVFSYKQVWCYLKVFSPCKLEKQHNHVAQIEEIKQTHSNIFWWYVLIYHVQSHILNIFNHGTQFTYLKVPHCNYQHVAVGILPLWAIQNFYNFHEVPGALKNDFLQSLSKVGFNHLFQSRHCIIK